MAAAGACGSGTAQPNPRDAVLASVIEGRARRSLLAPDGAGVGAAAGEAPKVLKLTSVQDDFGDTEPYECTMQVMLTDGSKRAARTLFEWLQQFVIEQVALRRALCAAGLGGRSSSEDSEEEDGDEFDDDYYDVDMPCLMAKADGFEAPQLCMSCGWWFTWYGIAMEEERRVVAEHKKAMMAARAGAIVLRQLDPTGTIARLVKPVLVPKAKDLLKDFPCKEAKVGSYLVNILSSEYGRVYWKHEDGAEAFYEHDYEDGTTGAFFLTTSPSITAVAKYVHPRSGRFPRLGAGWKVKAKLHN